ncbi:NmrA family NAD(P)-binding protein [Nonomuraea aurantiaca]|uniref:NmrA family NAD(P)-binding protein n=1 Tax=Nonomuraea aurantiaca TaxID=2878562 RepID=UPI001CD99B58|nr:NAD(P)H-binding protein [Nonomuraea aurantiaca]MCA2223542.1 NAD(P)H-binding protein [Nonomuraea aurantiaca]
MIVVTGATGTVGTLLVRGQRERGVPTRAISRTTASPEPGIQRVTADLDDMSTLVAAYADADAVFLVTPVHPRMARFARNVIEAAVRGGNRPRIVLLAAAGLDQNVRGVRFLNAHAEGLAALRASDLPYTVLAPNGFFQNLFTMAGAIRAGTLAAPAGDAAISFVDARDVADAAAHVLTTDGHDRATYTLTGPQSLTHAEIADQFGAVAGSNVRYSALSPEQARDQLTAAGLDPWRVDGLIELYGFYASGHAAAVSDDIERLLGRAPRSLAEFVADYRQAFSASTHPG